MTRDEILKLAREHGTGGWQKLDDMVRFGEAIAAAEREECAKVCDQIAATCRDENSDDEPFKWAAASIRARGES